MALQPGVERVDCLLGPLGRDSVDHDDDLVVLIGKGLVEGDLVLAPGHGGGDEIVGAGVDFQFRDRVPAAERRQEDSKGDDQVAEPGTGHHHGDDAPGDRPVTHVHGGGLLRSRHACVHRASWAAAVFAGPSGQTQTMWPGCGSPWPNRAETVLGLVFRRCQCHPFDSPASEKRQGPRAVSKGKPALGRARNAVRPDVD